MSPKASNYTAWFTIRMAKPMVCARPTCTFPERGRQARIRPSFPAARLGGSRFDQCSEDGDVRRSRLARAPLRLRRRRSRRATSIGPLAAEKSWRGRSNAWPAEGPSAAVACHAGPARAPGRRRSTNAQQMMGPDGRGRGLSSTYLPDQEALASLVRQCQAPGRYLDLPVS